MSKEKKTILIYDDERQRTNKFKGKLKKGLDKADQSDNFDVISLKDDEFQDAIEALQKRRIDFRKNKAVCLEGSPKDGREKIDDASIFIIDYDLLGSQVEESPTGYLTGEIIAYLVRCFSRCKMIVGLNQYGSNPFDLTLRGDPESFADLNLGENQLSNSDLWIGNWDGSRRGYRPWYWPNLSNSLDNFDEKVKKVKDNLDKPIYKIVGFDLELFQLLPHVIVQFIGQNTLKEPDQVTFRDFVTESWNGLNSKDTEKLKNSININDHILARIGAARISKWLESLVLPEQNILVDAPHLVSRYSSIITDDKKEIETWNKTAQLVEHGKLGLDTDLIEPFRFRNNCWVSRPVWFWDKLRECEAIKEVKDPWLSEKFNWVFCEDASRFYHRKDCKEFLADTVSPFTRRFAKGFKEVDYRPRFRFAL